MNSLLLLINAVPEPLSNSFIRYNRMSFSPIYAGNTLIQNRKGRITGQFVEIDDEKFYKISHYNQMPDFFMTIVSDSDHWMFISSNGALSAGRKDRNNALFPYYTVDKIHDSADLTGSKTLILASRQDKTFLWEPFSRESSSLYRIERNLYKSIYCNKIVFEEINLDLEVRFQYGWFLSESYGFVKKSLVQNIGEKPVSLQVLDGIRNILPAGADHDFQNAFSCLLDAYKKSELIRDTRLGIFTLSSIPVDKAEPSESLRASVVWPCNLNADAKIILSERQLENFRIGEALEEETDIRAARGAYYIHTSRQLTASETQSWMILAEVNLDSTGVHNLDHKIRSHSISEENILEDINKGTTRLKHIVARADGLQTGNDLLCTVRHFSNTLFNVMRGGIFQHDYTVFTHDFREFAATTNKPLAESQKSWFDLLPDSLIFSELINRAETTQHKDLKRICYEYLPLSFSRRHGDPSRPWNQFSIETKNEDGSEKLNFEGNWRDIFQNWEALALSFPGFLGSFISKFVNASTADGYNPYRITRNGIDWECPDPHDPWAYIGYWGDHQVIYLQKFLEMAQEFSPELLETLLTEDLFVYANVPYRIKPYKDQVKNPQSTIDFDIHLNNQIQELTRQMGSDGKLLRQKDGDLVHVNLTEKIWVSLLTKVGNFIPEAGIWLNTQRPEWNDANNALVGNGASMVTLYYLRRAMHFWKMQFSASTGKEYAISEEVADLLIAFRDILNHHVPLLKTGFDPVSRRRIADALGEAATNYRTILYEQSFSGIRKKIEAAELLGFTELVLSYLDQSIRVNKRDDGLFHAYNLISFTADGIEIRHLYEMLEGQVAVLSSGLLKPEEALEVLDALRNSSMYRQDQQSYLLYPDRQLPRFTEKNIIPAEKAEKSALISRLTAEKNSQILTRDDSGNYHFNWRFRNASLLSKALDELNPEQYGSLVRTEKESILALYEELFDHHSFTGRSGTFYAYEGLGSIYWHMASKLLLAAQECYFLSVNEKAETEVRERLKKHYEDIKTGLGLYKSPEVYGAFPTDAYSHTPGTAGAQQPGMTGQVKEDFLCRMRELGIHLTEGQLEFRHPLLSFREFLTQESIFEYYHPDGHVHQIVLHAGELGYTFCQVPVICHLGSENRIIIHFDDGKEVRLNGHRIDRETTSKILQRTGEIHRIDLFVHMPEHSSTLRLS